MDTLSKISIKTNYVLIKTEKDINQLKSGLSIMAGKENKRRRLANTEARHYNIIGTILAVPDKLIYRGEPLKELRDRTGGNYDDYGIKELQSLTNGSLGYKTEMEVQVGDTVWFDYLAHINAVTGQKTLEVFGYGECILVEYSRLFIRERKGVRLPINGNILVKKLYNDHLLSDGLVVPKTANTIVKNEAEVVIVGKPIKEYLSVKYTDQYFFDIKPGDRVIYNERIATPLEYSIHETAGLEDMFKIRRNDIHAIIRDGHYVFDADQNVNFKYPISNP